MNCARGRSSSPQPSPRRSNVSTSSVGPWSSSSLLLAASKEEPRDSGKEEFEALWPPSSSLKAFAFVRAVLPFPSTSPGARILRGLPRPLFCTAGGGGAETGDDEREEDAGTLDVRDDARPRSVIGSAGACLGAGAGALLRRCGAAEVEASPPRATLQGGAAPRQAAAAAFIFEGGAKTKARILFLSRRGRSRVFLREELKKMPIFSPPFERRQQQKPLGSPSSDVGNKRGPSRARRRPLSGQSLRPLCVPREAAVLWRKRRRERGRERLGQEQQD